MSQALLQLQLSSDDFDAENTVVRRFRKQDAVNELYAVELEIVRFHNPDRLPRPEDVLGATVQLTVSLADGTLLEHVHGMVAWARNTQATASTASTLALRIVPRAWRLTLYRTQELFVQQSIPDIVREKLERVELTQCASFNLVSDYPEREVVMQYQESDWDFVCRLCEHYGIAFFFVQEEEGEHLVFTDHDQGWHAKDDPVPYDVDGSGQGITELCSEASGTPGIFVVNDYNYRTPQVDLTGVASLDGGLAGGVVEFGTHHRTPDEGTLMATLRMEEAACRRVMHYGKSNVLGLTAGSVVRIDNHVDYEDAPLRIVSIEHEASAEEGFVEGEPLSYRNRFTSCPAQLPFRPSRRTPRPKMSGIINGVVQPGPEGEIGGRPSIDKDGRYLVQFHFDGADHGALPASQAVRMAQPFVGEGANGMHFPLQRGTEVLIAFIDGNPDRPIIVGAVPNASNPATVVARESDLSRIQTSRGVTIEFGRKH